jgi:dihydrofolate reductase
MISLIVAYDENRGIGAGNDIPWFIKGELKWVADTTKAVKNSLKVNALIMGRKTWESLPENRRPLPNRINIVISRTTVIDHDDVITCKSIEEAIHWANNTEIVETAFIFGGASIYKEALEKNLVDQVLATEVHVKKNYVKGVFTPNYIADTFFPKLPNTFSCYEGVVTEYGEDSVVRMIFKNKR